MAIAPTIDERILYIQRICQFFEDKTAGIKEASRLLADLERYLYRSIEADQIKAGS